VYLERGPIVFNMALMVCWHLPWI